MAFDLNIPLSDDEEDDPLGGLPHGQDHPPPAGAHPMELADGAPSVDINMIAYQPVASNFDLNLDLEVEEADEDADVYANDFHVVFAQEELQQSNDHVNQHTCNESDVFDVGNQTTTFDLNYALEEEVLDGSNDEEHVEQERPEKGNVPVGRCVKLWHLMLLEKQTKIFWSELWTARVTARPVRAVGSSRPAESRMTILLVRGPRTLRCGPVRSKRPILQ